MSQSPLPVLRQSPPHAGRRRRFRWAMRVACFIAAMFALLPCGLRNGWAVAVPSLSPWVALASLLATLTFHATLVVGLMVGVVAMLRPRWFCRWMCPMGLCCDLSGRLGRRLGQPSKQRRARPLWFRPLGPWIAVIALAGALCGYSALLWLDPLAIFSSFFGVFSPNANWASWIAVLGMPLILVLCIFLPGAWCRHVCPLGGLQDLLHVATQTVAAWKLRGHFGENSLSPRKDDVRRRQWLRRVALGGLIGVVWAFTAKTMRHGLPRPLRPPGACVDDATFLGLCVRCGNCVRVCPSHIIEFDTGKSGVAGLLTPVLHFQNDYCREDCVRCMEICPSGALKTHSLPEKQQIRIGFPHVDMRVCLLGEDQECAVCRNACPYEAITLVFSERDYILSPVIDFEKCSGCGACEVACPTKPIQAIRISPSLEQLPC